MRPNISARLRRAVRLRAGNVCEYCHLPQGFQEAMFHVDHIRPVARGGRTTKQNLALACVSCSLRKGARDKAIDPRSGVAVRLFNPRKDVWSNHFEFQRDWTIAGQSVIGRATIAALGMNRTGLILIRRELAHGGHL